MPRLRRYARSLIHDTGSADDLVQTTLERALSHWHQFDQRRDLLVWLLSIAHNAFMDQRRRDSRLSIIDPALVEAQQDALRSDPGVDVGLRIDLLAALARLPLDQRVPLLLVSVEQLSYAECAEALGIPIGTVMSNDPTACCCPPGWTTNSTPPTAPPWTRGCAITPRTSR